jgi:hypothetical protein
MGRRQFLGEERRLKRECDLKKKTIPLTKECDAKRSQFPKDGTNEKIMLLYVKGT